MNVIKRHSFFQNTSWERVEKRLIKMSFVPSAELRPGGNFEHQFTKERAYDSPVNRRVSLPKSAQRKAFKGLSFENGKVFNGPGINHVLMPRGKSGTGKVMMGSPF
jgi:hypothetical protein